MRAAIFNPYLDTLGGGERYSLSFALALSELGYKVDVEWKNIAIKKKLEERFGMNLNDINFIKDIGRGDGYDVCFWVSDGSIPTLRARKNFLHFQVPFHNVNGKTLINKMKLWRIKRIIVNSKFTKSIIDKEYGVDSLVIYPPVSVEKIKPKLKENIILFVGRFSLLKQAKNQDVLIRAFKKLYDSGFGEWRLILAGGSEIGGGKLIERLKKLSTGYPIDLVQSPSFKEIVNLYGKARIFWSAVGFGTDEDKEPEKVEHFGISVVEAMAGKAIPIVFNGGGYKEIINNGKNGFLWNGAGDLLKLTKTLINTYGLMSKLASETRKDAEKFGYERFNQEVKNLL